MNLRLLLGVLALTTVAASCGDDGITRTQSNDIFIDVSNVYFQRVRVGQSEAKPIEIRQGGETDLTVREIFIVPRLERLPDESDEEYCDRNADSGDTTYTECDRTKLGLGPNEPFPAAIDNQCQFTIDERPELPLTLGSDEFKQVTVRYRAMEATPPPPALMVVKSNALDKECQLVNLEVQLAAPRISATETVVAFAGNQPQNTTLLVKNIGTGDLNVQPYTLTVQTPQAQDPITGDPVAEFRVEVDTDFPWVIPEGGAENITIFYEPVDDITDRAELILRSNDEQTPEFKITLTSEPVFGIVNVMPNPVIFDTPSPGSQVERVVTVSNSGLKKVDIYMEIEQPGEDYTLSGQPSFQLVGGASKELSVTYQPATAEGSNGTLVIETDADNANAEGKINVPLTADGASLPPLVTIDPGAATFVGIEEGASDTVTVTVTNAGGSDLEITSIALSGDGADPIPPTDPEFELTSGGGATTLGPNDTHEFEVTFSRAAGDRQLHLGAVVIESNAPTSPDVVYLTADALSQ